MISSGHHSACMDIKEFIHASHYLGSMYGSELLDKKILFHIQLVWWWHWGKCKVNKKIAKHFAALIRLWSFQFQDNRLVRFFHKIYIVLFQQQSSGWVDEGISFHLMSEMGGGFELGLCQNLLSIIIQRISTSGILTNQPMREPSFQVLQIHLCTSARQYTCQCIARVKKILLIVLF